MDKARNLMMSSQTLVDYTAHYSVSFSGLLVKITGRLTDDEISLVVTNSMIFKRNMVEHV